MRVHWSSRARRQVTELVEYIARDRPIVAESILLSFLERVELLAELPEQGTLWGDGSRPDLRQVIHESYHVVYRVGVDEVSILSVRHTRMGSHEEV